MTKTPKSEQDTAREEAFEIIELASQDLQTLTRAFDLISEVCDELGAEGIQLADDSSETVLN